MKQYDLAVSTTSNSGATITRFDSSAIVWVEEPPVKLTLKQKAQLIGTALAIAAFVAVTVFVAVNNPLAFFIGFTPMFTIALLKLVVFK